MPPRVPISKKLLLINSVSQLITRILLVTVVVWAIQYLVDRIPAEEYKLLPAVTALMVFVPVLQNLLAGGLSRYVTEAYANDDVKRVTELTSTMFPILLGAGVLLATGGLFAAWHVDSIIPIAPAQLPDARLMFGLLILSAAISLPVAPFGVGLVVRQRYVVQNAVQLLGAVLRMGLLLILLLGVGPEIKWVVVSQVTANLLVLALKTFFSLRLLPGLRYNPGAFKREHARELIGFNGWHSLLGLSGTIREASDPLLLTWFAPATQVVAFDLGGIFDRELRRLSTFASQPLDPVLTAMHSQGAKDRLANAYLRGGRIGLWVMLVPTLMFIVFGEELYRYYLGEKFATYEQCALVAALLVAIYPTHYARWMLHKIGLATANLRGVALLTLALHSTNLACTLILVIAFERGAIGCAFATFAVSTAFNIFAFFPLAIRLLDIPWKRFFSETLIPGCVPWIAATLVALTAISQVHDGSSSATLFAFSASIVVYILVLLTFCLRSNDRRDISRVWDLIRDRRKSVSFL